MDQIKIMLLGEVASEYQDELCASGTIDGRDIDEFDAMSRNELRTEISRLRRQIDSGHEQLQKKTDKINDLDGKLRQLREVKPGAVARRSNDAFNEISAACFKFRETCPQGQSLTPDDIAAIHRLLEGAYRVLDITVEFLGTVYPEAYDDTPAAVHLNVRRSATTKATFDAAAAANVADIHP